MSKVKKVPACRILSRNFNPLPAFAKWKLKSSSSKISHLLVNQLQVLYLPNNFAEEIVFLCKRDPEMYEI